MALYFSREETEARYSVTDAFSANLKTSLRRILRDKHLYYALAQNAKFWVTRSNSHEKKCRVQFFWYIIKRIKRTNNSLLNFTSLKFIFLHTFLHYIKFVDLFREKPCLIKFYIKHLYVITYLVFSLNIIIIVMFSPHLFLYLPPTKIFALTSNAKKYAKWDRERDSAIVLIFLFSFFPEGMKELAMLLTQSRWIRLLDRECSSVRDDITWRVTPAWCGAVIVAFHGIVYHDSPYISNWKASKNVTS